MQPLKEVTQAELQQVRLLVVRVGKRRKRGKARGREVEEGLGSDPDLR